MGLQVAGDPEFHRREEIARRVGLVVVVALLAAASVGLMGGPGPLSTATVSDAAGVVTVAYTRFVRQDADEAVEVTVAGGAVAGGDVEVELSAGWLAGIRVDTISPEPVRQVQNPDAVALVFPARPATPLRARVSYRATVVGPLHGWVRVGQATVRLDQFAYP